MMHITVTSANTKTGIACIRSLFEEGIGGGRDVSVQGLYRDPSKAPRDLLALSNFEAKKGSIVDAASLDFSSSDAVLVILPPLISGSDPLAECRRMCENVKEAIDNARLVKKVVLLSSVGAEFDKGTGELLTNHISEEVISSISGPHVSIARCSYFMENWTASTEGLRAPEPFFFSPLTPPTYHIPMVAVDDIGKQLARTVFDDNEKPQPYVFDLQGPTMYSPLDVQIAFGQVLGKEVAMRPIPKEGLGDFFGAVFPDNIAKLYVEMTRSVLPGGIAAMDSPLRDRTRDVVHGSTTLEDALRKALSG